MNDDQHDTLREVKYWEHEVAQAEIALGMAKVKLAAARSQHGRAVNQDRASWESA